MEWSDLQVFLAAVRAGSYTAAGRQLNINRTTVGRRIDALEVALGMPLFDDTPLGPAPTRAGKRLLAAADAMDREVAMMLDELGTPQHVGPIRIAGSAAFTGEFLPELLAFRRENPNCPIELLGELDPLEAVTYRRADLAIAMVRNPPLRLSGVQVAILSQAPYARRDAPSDLPPLGWGYEFDAALPGGHWAAANPVGEAAEKAGLATFNTWPQLKQAVLAGFGHAMLWCFSGDAEPSLHRLAPADPRHDCPLWLLHRAKAPPAPSLTKLIAFLQHRLGMRLADRKRPI
jgi:DNA-binding transcriptional LysR family regulator